MSSECHRNGKVMTGTFFKGTAFSRQELCRRSPSFTRRRLWSGLDMLISSSGRQKQNWGELSCHEQINIPVAMWLLGPSDCDTLRRRKLTAPGRPRPSGAGAGGSVLSGASYQCRWAAGLCRKYINGTILVTKLGSSAY